MAKTKITVEVEVESGKLPKDWEKIVADEFFSLNDKTVFFPNGVKSFIKIKKTEIKK